MLKEMPKPKKPKQPESAPEDAKGGADKKKGKKGKEKGGKGDEKGKGEQEEPKKEPKKEQIWYRARAEGEHTFNLADDYERTAAQMLLALITDRPCYKLQADMVLIGTQKIP